MSCSPLAVDTYFQMSALRPCRSLAAGPPHRTENVLKFLVANSSLSVIFAVCFQSALLYGRRDRPRGEPSQGRRRCPGQMGWSVVARKSGLSPVGRSVGRVS